jgi:hypothetical protein
MRFTLSPKSGLQTRLTIRSGQWESTVTLDDLTTSVDCKLPSSVKEDEVDAFVRYIEPSGQLAPFDAIVLKTKARPRKGRK